MKRLLVLVVLLVLFVNSAFAEPWRVFDNADIFTEEEEESIEEAITDFQRSTNMDFVVLSTDDYVGEPDDVAQFFYQNGPFGFGASASGFIYYVSAFHREDGVSWYGIAQEKASKETVEEIWEGARSGKSSWEEILLSFIKQLKALVLDE